MTAPFPASLVALGLLAAAPPPAPAPAAAKPEWPIAKKVPHVRELGGEKFTDDYFWLREKGTSDVEAYLNAEDAYALKELAPLQPLVADQRARATTTAR
jgi:oligopeptidase B